MFSIRNVYALLVEQENLPHMWAKFSGKKVTRFFLIVSLLFIGTKPLEACEKSLEELDRLLLCRTTPEADKEAYAELIIPLVKNLEHTCCCDVTINRCLLDIKFTLPPLKEDQVLTYRPFNPSIIRTEQGYDLICRTSNYKVPEYRTILPGDITKNKNFFLKYDRHFNLLSEQEIPPLKEEISREINKNWQVEDCRIFNWNGAYWCLASAVISPNTDEYLPKIALCRFGDIQDDVPVTIESLTLFHGPDPKRWEKNWMSVIQEGTLRFIYSYDPFILLEPNIVEGTCETILSYKPSLDFSRFRGSAAPIEFDGGYLMMVHERLQRFQYVHRFLYLDSNFKITKLSLPFTFLHSGVEFCTSMTIDHSGKNLVIPIGIDDHEAKIMVVDLTYVKGLLSVIPDAGYSGTEL